MYKMAARSPFRAALFRDRVAVVTGGGSGIGAAVAAELLALECNVVIASRKIERLREAAEQLSAALVDSNPAKVTPIQCNIRKEDDVRNLMQKVLEFHGQIDYLVNNGGGQFISPAEHISTKGWNAVIDTNLTGTFLCCREGRAQATKVGILDQEQLPPPSFPHPPTMLTPSLTFPLSAYCSWMKENGGAIVNIVADMWKGFPGVSHTGAARAAVDNLTKSLAIEWADSGVRVNSVAPGMIFSESAVANYKEHGPQIFRSYVPRIPAKRLGVPEETMTAGRQLQKAGILNLWLLSSLENHPQNCSSARNFHRADNTLSAITLQ
ncbi:peroxisomal trans-2-enoyl-CoA reductase isoform X2 [Mobula hypostoma]|uniref:peroxisomal trans-2-enoyl-CoA reductase isoform X2 n=1 Tax=Mobula hypostoma TaxID=723540 RepID=UPI002FC2D23A